MTLKEFAKQAKCLGAYMSKMDNKKHKKKSKLAGAFIRTKVAQVITSQSRYKPSNSFTTHLSSKSKRKIPGVRIVGSGSQKLY